MLNTTSALLPDVESQARGALASSPIHSHRRVEVAQDGAVIYLNGRVESFYYKQMAQEVVRNICRGIEVVNQINVDEPTAAPSAFSSDV